MDDDDKDSMKLIGGAVVQKDAVFGYDPSKVLETQTVGAGSVAMAPAQCGTCSTAFSGDKVMAASKAEHASSGASGTVVASGENGHTESAAGCEGGCGGSCGPMVAEDPKANNAKSGGCGSGCGGGCGGGGGCGTMLKASAMANEGQSRGTLLNANSLGQADSAGCGSGCGGGCGSGMVMEGSKANNAKSGGCGSGCGGGCGSGCGGGCGTLFNASTAAGEGLPNKSAGCGSGCGGGGCGSGMAIEGSKTNHAKSGGCGSGCGGGCGGGCGTLFRSGTTAADQGQPRSGGGGCGSGCGGGCGSGSMIAEGSNGRQAKSGGCGSGCGGGCGGGGGCGTVFNASTKAGSGQGQNSMAGGCGSGCGGGGCGGGCGTIFKA